MKMKISKIVLAITLASSFLLSNSAYATSIITPTTGKVISFPITKTEFNNQVKLKMIQISMAESVAQKQRDVDEVKLNSRTATTTKASNVFYPLVATTPSIPIFGTNDANIKALAMLDARIVAKNKIVAVLKTIEFSLDTLPVLIPPIVTTK